MNLIRLHQCANINCLSKQKESIIDDDDDNNRPTFTRTVYQVDAKKICQIIKQNENKHLCKTFGQLLYSASIDRLDNKCQNQDENILLLTNAPDLISIAINWNPLECTTSDVEDFISIIKPFVYLRELFYDVIISHARNKQLNLIGVICFYTNTIEVFFSYEHSTSKWLFCFDGNVTIINDWNGLIRKCIDFHLQPFLLIYANSQQNPVDISQLLKRTIIQTNLKSNEKRLEYKKYTMTNQEQYELHSLDNLSKISSFATLNSSMLFMPKSTTNSSYINQEAVAKVMQQQLLKKESLLLSSIVHNRDDLNSKQKSDDNQSNEDSSTSSLRDSGLSSGINDGSSDDSTFENNLNDIDSLIHRTEMLMNDNSLNTLIVSIEYQLEQALKHECTNNFLLALEHCQKALTLIDRLNDRSQDLNSNILIYVRTRKTNLLLRINSLKKQFDDQNLTSAYHQVMENTEKTSILTSTKRSFRPKKNVKFSDNIALIVPTSHDPDEQASEHLIHSFLRQYHHQSTVPLSDSDSDTPSSLNDTSIGLLECSLCCKRYSKTNEQGTFCSNCYYYMQRFQPLTP